MWEDCSATRDRPQIGIIGRSCAEKEAGCVIVNWNCSSDTLACVGHILGMHPVVGCIVVDNGSEAAQVKLLEQNLPRTVFLATLPENGGYARGVNEGLKIAKERGWNWLWLINPDSRALPGCLEELLDHRLDAVAISPAQYSSKSPEILGDVYTSAARISRGRVRGFTCTGCDAGSHNVSVVTGTGLLINVGAAKNAGALNEGFFHYKEEFEFIERLSSLGEVRLACNAQIWHRRGASLSPNSALAQYYRWRNEILYLRIRGGRRWWASGKFPRLVLRAAFSSSLLRTDLIHAQFIGICDGIVGKTGPRS